MPLPWNVSGVGGEAVGRHGQDRTTRISGLTSLSCRGDQATKLVVDGLVESCSLSLSLEIGDTAGREGLVETELISLKVVYLARLP